jgi:hypothetical protein
MLDAAANIDCLDAAGVCLAAHPHAAPQMTANVRAMAARSALAPEADVIASIAMATSDTGFKVPILLVDSNSFHRPELLSYLSSTTSNRIAITEEVLVEMHKNEPALTIRKTLQTVRPFANQIVILKGASQLHARAISSAAQSRWIVDKLQTSRFADWYDEVCEGLLTEALATKQSQAKSYMGDIKAQVGGLEPTFRKIKRRFTQEELKILRSNSPASAQTQAKLIELMFEISLAMFRAIGVSEKERPTLRYEAFDYFVFRYAMCMTLFYIRWVQNGNLSPNDEALANHVIDLHVATMGTFFSGVCSQDGMLRDISRTARMLLRLSGQAYLG